MILRRSLVHFFVGLPQAKCLQCGEWTDGQLVHVGEVEFTTRTCEACLRLIRDWLEAEGREPEDMSRAEAMVQLDKVRQ